MCVHQLLWTGADRRGASVVREVAGGVAQVLPLEGWGGELPLDDPGRGRRWSPVEFTLWHGLAVAAAVIYPLGSIWTKLAVQHGGGVMRSTLLSNWMLAVLGLLLIPGIQSMPDWRQVHWPLMAAGVFLVGQVGTVLAVRAGDVSVQTPMMGFKVVFVALMTMVIRPEDVSPGVWLAVALSAAAMFLIAGGSLAMMRANVGAVGWSLVACAGYASTDLFMAYGSDGFGRDAFLPVTLWFMGLASLLCLPLVREGFGRVPRAAWRWLLPGSGMFAIQGMLICLAVTFGRRAPEMNVLYSVRGATAVVMVWLVGRWLGSQEGRTTGHRVLLRRLLGALAMAGALVILLA